MLGCLKPDSGNIIVMGENIGGVQHRGINRKIGFVLDHHGFSPDLSAFANLLYYGRLQGFRKPDIIIAKELMDSRIELDLNNTIRAYSKGMLQQLAIIRALLHRPSLLILDSSMGLIHK